MCGISGILTFKGPSGLQNIQSMTKAMRHRGPDDEGFAFFEANSKNTHIFGGNDTPEEVLLSPNLFHPTEYFTGETPANTILALGHRRLSILDLSAAGHQPMFTEDGRYCIVHNGEIYNYQEIREELRKKGELFFSNTDTEVIIKAYRAWGENCLHQFNGMWSFAIWDNHDKTLFCSRDRIGIKPFYYLLNPHFFIFASDIKTLIASELYTPEPNWEGVYHAMSLQCAPRPMTCFKNIKALEAGHYMIFDLHASKKGKKYWQIPIGEIDYSKNEQRWIDELEQTLIQAVKRRLVADVRVGTFMSGGIDSTTISAIAAKEHPGITAFTLAYSQTDSDLDELPQAKATAAMWPMKHVFEQVSFEKLTQDLQSKILCYEEPFQGLSPSYSISELAAANKITVVLSGLGADELFCGYGRERTARQWMRIKRLKPVFAMMPAFNQKITKAKALSALKNIIEVYVYAFSPFLETEKQKLFNIGEARSWNTPATLKSIFGLEGKMFSNAIEGLTYIDLANYIGNHHVYRNDQFSMLFSIETRFPFLDHELVELACRMPSTLKVRHAIGKYILKQVSKKYIHSSCLNAAKKGFSMPLEHWMRLQLNPFLHDKLQALKKRGIFNDRRLDSLFDGFLQGKKNYRKLWNLISIELWLESLIEGNSKPT